MDLLWIDADRVSLQVGIDLFVHGRFERTALTVRVAGNRTGKPSNFVLRTTSCNACDRYTSCLFDQLLGINTERGFGAREDPRAAEIRKLGSAFNRVAKWRVPRGDCSRRFRRNSAPAQPGATDRSAFDPAASSTHQKCWPLALCHSVAVRKNVCRGASIRSKLGRS